MTRSETIENIIDNHFNYDSYAQYKFETKHYIDLNECFKWSDTYFNATIVEYVNNLIQGS